MSVPTSTHQLILSMLAKRWIDMGGGRDKLAKHRLPPHAHETSPCLVVEALDANEKPESLSTQFVVSCPETRRNMAQVPIVLAWHLVLPTGQTYFICRWMNWQPNTVDLLRAFCDRQGRTVGTLDAEGRIELGSKRISFQDCRLIHEDELKSARRTSQQTPPARLDVVAIAKELLRSRRSELKALEVHEFESDAEAHDDTLQNKVERDFTRRFRDLCKQMSDEFGNPTETGQDVHDAIPLNGVFQFATWQRATKTLFLAATHEDRELPYLLVLGTAIKRKKQVLPRR